MSASSPRDLAPTVTKAPGSPKVVVCSLGGTIAMTDADGGPHGGVAPTLDAQALVETAPGLARFADISTVAFRHLPGAHLNVQDIIELAQDLRSRVGTVDGIVVTQGTDTLEETAFLLDLLWDAAAPVVITGAMRNPTLTGSDGVANLEAAVQVAASPAAHGIGCLVVLNDEIHAARFVRKLHTSNPAAFASPLTGRIGWVSEGTARIPLHPVGRYRIAADTESPQPAVALLKVVLGDDGDLIDAVSERGYAGLVVEAFGGGHVNPTLADRLAKTASRIPVVVASRTGTGELLSETYGFPGSERDLLGRHMISAGFLDGLKARLLLMLLLRSAANRDAIQQAFNTVGSAVAGTWEISAPAP